MELNEESESKMTEILPNCPVQMLEEIWVEIFSYLSNESMFIAMQTYEDWKQIISNSSHLLNKFQLNINENFVEYWKDRVQDLPKVPIRRIKITHVFLSKNNCESLLNILKVYEDSVEDIELDLELDYISTLKRIFNLFGHLKTITVRCDFLHKDPEQPMTFEHLKTLNVVLRSQFGRRNYILNLFKSNKSIETFSFTIENYRPYCHPTMVMTNLVANSEFDDFLSSLPNLRNFNAPESYIDECNVQMRLEKFSSNTLGRNRQQQIKFLEFHKDSLKSLSFKELPTGDHGGELIRFMFNEIKLENLYWSKTPLILDCKRQKSSKCVLDIQHDNISANMAIAEFITIKKIKIDFKILGSNDDVTNLNPLNQSTKILSQVTELKLAAKTGLYFSSLHGFFENCKNIKKLFLNLWSFNFDYDLDFLKFYLATLTQLEEFEMRDLKEEHKLEFFEVVREYCENLKVLRIKEEYLEEARIIFGKNVKIERLSNSICI